MSPFAVAVVVGLLVAQEPEALTITPRWTPTEFLSGRAPLELTLSRKLNGSAERLAVLVGTTDVTALVDVNGTRVRYRPVSARLPTGQSEVAAYLVNTAGEWQEIGRFPLNVRSPLGLDQGRIVPTADLSSNGPLNQYVAPGAPPPERRAYQDLTLRLGFESAFARDGWQLNTQVNAMAMSEETQRLRFSALQAEAPALDLSDYRLQLTRGPLQFSLGQVTAGTHRHLLNSVTSRGVSGRVRIAPFATLDGAMMNGSGVVGWENLSGLARPDHRMSSINLSLELRPARPGALHFELNGFDGSLLPITSFNQGAVTDAEESQGYGGLVSFSTPAQRVRFSGGIARSRFRNPSDPLLEQDQSVVAVRPTTRVARFGQLDVQLIQGLQLAPAWPLAITAAVRHERVDPLYRSLGASLQADVENNAIDINTSLGAVALSASFSNSRDNLAELASVLTSNTRMRGLNLALPVASLFDGPDWYWPALTASWQRVHQFGTDIPVNADFTATHVPDQMSTVWSASAGWTHGLWSVAYRWNQSQQDNRQTGRENADFRASTHGASVAFSPVTWLRSTVDLSVERQLNHENSIVQRVKRLGGNAQLQVWRLTALSGTVSQAWGLDPFAQQRTRNTELQFEVAQGFTAYRRQDNGSQGRLFIRYARTRAATVPFVPQPRDPLINWTLTAGSSIRLY